MGCKVGNEIVECKRGQRFISTMWDVKGDTIRENMEFLGMFYLDYVGCKDRCCWLGAV